MNFLQAIMGGMVSLVVYGMILAGVYKVFKISTDLTEIKDLLRDIKRAAEADTPAYRVPPAPYPPQYAPPPYTVAEPAWTPDPAAVDK